MRGFAKGFGESFDSKLITETMAENIKKKKKAKESAESYRDMTETFTEYIADDKKSTISKLSNAIGTMIEEGAVKDAPTGFDLLTKAVKMQKEIIAETPSEKRIAEATKEAAMKGIDVSELKETRGEREPLGIIARKIREAEEKKVQEKGLVAETAGKATMLQQAYSDLEDVEKLLFYKDSKGEERFAKGLATAANIPMGKFPFLGRIIPDVGFGTKAREIASKLNNALEAKLRIETGAAATQEEFDRLQQRFGITMFDSMLSAKDKIKRLKEFLVSGTAKIDPTGKFRYQVGGSELGTTPSGIPYTITEE